MYNKVIIIKDIYFNKEKVFNGNIKIFKYNIKNISIEYLVKVIKSAIRKVIIIILLITHNNTAKDLEWSYKSKGNKEKIRPLENLVPVWRNKYIITVLKLLPTSPDTPLKCLFVAVLITAMLKNTPSKNPLSVWEYEFKLV